MFAFFFLSAVLSLYLLGHQEAMYRRAAILGILCGAVFSVFAILFTSGHRMYSAFFWGNFFHSLMFESLVPLAVLTAIAFVSFRGETRCKAAVLLPVFLGFFVLYAPFRVFFRSDSLSFFVLFVKPVLLASSVAGVASCIGLLVPKENESRRPAFLASVCGLGIISAGAPAAAEACWFMGLPMILWIIVGLAGLCSPLLLAACRRLESGRKFPAA